MSQSQAVNIPSLAVMQEANVMSVFFTTVLPGMIAILAVMTMGELHCFSVSAAVSRDCYAIGSAIAVP